MTSADRAQAWTLGSTLGGTAVGGVCALTKGRSKGVDAALAVLVAIIGVVPILAGLYENHDKKAPRQADGHDLGDNAPSPSQLPPSASISKISYCPEPSRIPRFSSPTLMNSRQSLFPSSKPYSLTYR